MTVIADTGFIVAVAIRSEKHHAACVRLYQRETLILVPQSVLAETAYLLTRLAGNGKTAEFLAGLGRSKYRLTALVERDITRTAEILRQYVDSRVDFVDASIAAVAERLSIETILTLDHRDFSIIRPLHCSFFQLAPGQHES